MDASDNPVNRKYQRREISTGDFAIPDQPLDYASLDARGNEGISIAQEVPEIDVHDDYLKQLAFNEEPVTIRIETNPRADYAETHAPCSVNGRGAEVLTNGKWVPLGWLPIGQVIVTKRKYVEVLARSNETSVRTVHQEADVADPQNRERRTSSRPYPFTVVRDDNPLGHEWLTRILMNAV